ncbi:hypothetical protein [Anaerocolumna sp. MB42-C2]|uniref:hypothetical protein n=1 Tax=Anaerocolumna sp. MB42-C2 TaxID=3070997 RepID=UPI0027DFD761|nr:hypothetical protein [Anaerocolumna sp. MB42-C2]WMJ90017.1 hypothetical protein RBU59_10960 [Anaerocolumna sp. MB42-C2]
MYWGRYYDYVVDETFVDGKDIVKNQGILSEYCVENREKISVISGENRTALEGISISKDIKKEIPHYLSKLGENNAYTVRLSATAEDLYNANLFSNVSV